MPFRSVSKVDTPTTNPAPAKPTGVVAGDFLIALCVLDTTNTITLPTGFTAFTGSPVSMGSPDGLTCAAGWKIAGGSEPSTYPFTTAGSNAIAAIAAWSGIDNTTPIHKQATVKTVTTAPTSPISMAPNAYAATTLTCDLVTLFGVDSTSSRDWVITPPAGNTVRWDNITADFFEGGICSEDSIAAGATTAGTPVATSSGGAAGYTIFNVALANASGGGTTLTPSAAVSTWTSPSPTLSAGPLSLTPSAAASTSVAGTATLAAGGLTLSPTAPARSWTAPTPSLTVGAVTLSPLAAASTWTVLAPTLSAGALALASAAAASSWNVPASLLSVGSLSLTSSAAVATWTAGTASLSGGSTFTPSAAVSTWHAGVATLSVAPITLTTAAAVSTWNTPVPVLNAAGVTLAPTAPHNAWNGGVAALSAGPLTLAPIAAATAWHAGAGSLSIGAVILAAAAAVARWFAGSAVLIPATHHLDEPLSIDFDSLASAIDFASLETALDFDDLTTAIDFTQLTTAIDFDSLETVLVFLDGGTEVFELTIIKGEVTAIAMTLRGADPVTGDLVPYDVTVATTVKLNAGKPGATLIINAKDLTRTDAANGRVTYNPIAPETDVGGKYDALVVATFPGSPPLIRKFPGKLTIKDAIA